MALIMHSPLPMSFLAQTYPHSNHCTDAVEKLHPFNNFDEDEGICDEFHLNEDEQNFGLAADNGDSEDSDEASIEQRFTVLIS